MKKVVDFFLLMVMVTGLIVFVYTIMGLIATWGDTRKFVDALSICLGGAGLAAGSMVLERVLFPKQIDATPRYLQPVGYALALLGLAIAANSIMVMNELSRQFTSFHRFPLTRFSLAAAVIIIGSIIIAKTWRKGKANS